MESTPVNDQRLEKTFEAGLTVLIALAVRIAYGTNGMINDKDLLRAKELFRSVLANADKPKGNT
jgi:hypothetical protein